MDVVTRVRPRGISLGLVCAGVFLTVLPPDGARQAAGQASSEPPLPSLAPTEPFPEAAPAEVPAVAYHGIAPGVSSGSPLSKLVAKVAGPSLVWVGFQMTADGSRVFLQTTAPADYEMQKAKTAVQLTLRGCRIHLRNNGRKLDTRFFATPVRFVSPRQRRKDVAVAIALKTSLEVTARTEAGPEGSQFLILDFPPGNPDEVR